MKKPIIFFTSVIMMVVILSVVQVVVSNSLSTTGIELSKIQKKRAFFARENAILRERLLTSSSLIYVASRAGELGFVEEKERMFINQAIPIAISHDR